jgi:tetratricopeptide (TPR) repeat protein
MKKLILSLGIISMSLGAYAQKSEINEAKKIWDLFTAMPSKNLSDNLKNLDAGLKRTDNAIANEKTKISPQAWSLRASLSSAISLLDTLSTENSEAKQKIAEEAIVKATELDKKGEEAEALKNAKINVDNAVQTRAIVAYRKNDFATAYKYFNEFTTRNPQDTNMYFNAGVAARQSQNYDAAIKSFRKAIELGHQDSKSLYLDIVSTQLTTLKDTTAAMASISEALVKYPDDADFIGTQTDVYILREEIEKSRESLNKLIVKDPSKAVYHFLLGETYYKQALNVQKERQKIDAKKVKEYNAASAKMTSLIDEALPFYKKAYELDPKAAHTLETLKQIYAFKNDTKNYEEISKALNALPKQ